MVIAVSQSATFVYVLNAVAALVFALLLLPIRVRPTARLGRRETHEHATRYQLREGMSFLQRTPIMLAAITLDLFAVLFGGGVGTIVVVLVVVLLWPELRRLRALREVPGSLVEAHPDVKV